MFAGFISVGRKQQMYPFSCVRGFLIFVNSFKTCLLPFSFNGFYFQFCPFVVFLHDVFHIEYE